MPASRAESLGGRLPGDAGRAAPPGDAPPAARGMARPMVQWCGGACTGPVRRERDDPPGVPPARPPRDRHRDRGALLRPRRGAAPRRAAATRPGGRVTPPSVRVPFLLALDPGLDEVGWAILRWPANGTLASGQAASPLVALGTWYSTPRDAGTGRPTELVARLAQHSGRLRALLALHSTLTCAVLERQTTTTVYARHRAAGTTAVKQAAALRRLGLPLPTRTSVHARAALACGLRWLADGRHRAAAHQGPVHHLPPPTPAKPKRRPLPHDESQA